MDNELYNKVLSLISAVFDEKDILEHKQVVDEEIKKRLTDSHFLEALNSSDPKRTREFKKLVKDIKKRMYYEKRTFFAKGGSHVSIEERGPSVFGLVDVILEIMKASSSYKILDLGCGLFPIYFFKVAEEKGVEVRYYAVDSNKRVIEILSDFSKNLRKSHLYPILADISKSSPRELLSTYEVEDVDIVLLFRTLHTLIRTKRVDPVDFLSEIPARYLLITEPRRSLVKKEDITKRELRFLKGILRKLMEAGFVSSGELRLLEDDVLLIIRS